MGRVPIVEADTAVAAALDEWLREPGHEVPGNASTTEQVQGLLASFDSIDGALLDISLRGEQCEDVAAALKARSIPLLLRSAYAPAVYASQRVLAKPFKAAAYHKC